MQSDLEQNKAMVRQWYAELDKANLDALNEVLSENVVVHFPGESKPIDIERLQKN